MECTPETLRVKLKHAFKKSFLSVKKSVYLTVFYKNVYLPIEIIAVLCTKSLYFPK